MNIFQKREVSKEARTSSGVDRVIKIESRLEEEQLYRYSTASGSDRPFAC